MTKRYIIPIFVPHYGCPNNCIFCNQRKITDFSTDMSPEDVEKIIEKYLSYFWKDIPIEVAFYGGSFTAIDMEKQNELLEVVYRYKKKGIIDGIRLSTRPDAIDNIILDNLKRYEVDTIELGVQSLVEDVLIASERGHNIEDVYEAVQLIKDYGFELGLQMMVGLPLDNIEKSIHTTKEFIKMQADIVRIYPTLVIKDTKLEKLYRNNEYQPLKVKEAVDICTILLVLFYLNDIKVIRVGLQPTDNIQLGRDVVAGPFHPAFRQIVEANIFKLVLDDYFSFKRFNTQGEELVIKANKSIVSSIVGQKSSNIKYFSDKYGFKKIKIFSEDIPIDVIKISLEYNIYVLNFKNLMKEFLRKLNY